MEEQRFATQRHTVTGPQQVYSPDPIRTRGGILSEVDEIEKVQKGKKNKMGTLDQGRDDESRNDP
jgi:hypothetical protein